MTVTSITWTEETVDAPGMQLHLIKGGAGAPLLVMHDEIGHPGWLRFHAALAEHFCAIPGVRFRLGGLPLQGPRDHRLRKRQLACQFGRLALLVVKSDTPFVTTGTAAQLH